MIAPSEFSGFQDKFNRRGKQRLSQRATTLRTDLILDAVVAFKEFAHNDIRTRASKLERMQFWIADDVLQIPTENGEWRSSRSFALKNSDASERLRFHIPVPDVFDDDDPEVINNFQTPTEIYTERIRYARGIGETTVRLAIDADHTYAYRSSLETGDEEEINTIDVWAAFHREFDPGIDAIVRLSSDLFNWSAVKQREVIMNPADGSLHGFDI